ncbi:MAG: type II toxin-antitoxin system RelE/ParE family toxin [Parabacteroides sp.]|nr:type II toxin-antitoxin system RelE/ParE family toxin [Parabacteroides sp.]
MKYKIETFRDFNKAFKRLSKKYHSLKSDLAALVGELEQNPQLGVDLGNGLHKVRMAIASKGKGKSHGARVITHTAIVSVEDGVITLLYIYDKADQDSITDKELVELMKRFL